MTSNIDRTAEVIADALRPALSIADGIGRDLARILADAGCLMPDLPEPQTFPNGEREWSSLDGWVNLDPDGKITVVYDERDEDDIAAGAEIDPGVLVFTRISDASDLALAFLAATDHAEREASHAQDD